MINLNDYEKTLNKNDLVKYWLLNKEISFDYVVNSYVEIIEKEIFNYKDMLSKSDIYVATLIDNDKNAMDYYRPYAIKYILKNERFKGSQWYKNLYEREANND